MDCWVKPGNDSGKAAQLQASIPDSLSLMCVFANLRG